MQKHARKKGLSRLDFTPTQWLVLGGLTMLTLAVLGGLASVILKSTASEGGSGVLAPTVAVITPTLAQVSTAMETAEVRMSPTVSITKALPPSPTLQATPQPAPVASLYPTPVWRQSPVPSDAELTAHIASMSIQDKIGQMVMVGFHGQSLAASPELRTMVGTYHVGGVVLLEANAHDPHQLRTLTGEIQNLAMAAAPQLPLFIAINHEGGIVVRITEGVTEFPGSMALGATDNPAYAYTAAAFAAQELRAMGVNMNLAPVLDVNDNPWNPVIGTRSFGEDPELVAEYGRLAVRGTQAHGVIAVVKHFPGHGSVDVDSHGGLPVLNSAVPMLMQHELRPFSTTIRAGVVGVMSAHIAIPALDPSGLPATLSAPILTGLLRERMKHDGLLVTDSLGMAGASAGRGQPQAALEAVKAGADIVLSTTPMDTHIAIIQTLVAAVERGEISMERIDQSVLRILRVKHAYGLFEPLPAFERLQDVNTPEHQAAADRMARQAVTVLQDPAQNIPLQSPQARLMLISPDQLPPATAYQGTFFGELLQQRGYNVTEYVLNLNTTGSRNAAYAALRENVYDVIIFGEWELVKRQINYNDEWQETFINYLKGLNLPLIVVAWHNPAALLSCPSDVTFMTAYGNTRAQVKAIVDVLGGDLKPSGRLPMTLR